MSYLSIPRLHFAGNFQADPSTVNNRDANWDPTVPLTNNRVAWNPNGTHNWQLINCTVRGAVSDQGPFTSPGTDPVIGAQVLSAGMYPAKLVDLDPDNQGLSQIWGLQVQISIPDPANPAKPLASVTGTMPPTAFGDLWNRANNGPGGMHTMSAAFQAVLQNVTWVNPAASPLLAALQKISPSSLSIRFMVDSFQPDSDQANFTHGRVVGTIGPALKGEAPRSAPRRMVSPGSYGSAPFLLDASRQVLVLDLGNCVPTRQVPPSGGFSVPPEGWPIADATFQLTVPGLSPNGPAAAAALKSAKGPSLAGGASVVLGSLDFTLATYLNFAGIVEVPVSVGFLPLVQTRALTLTDTTDPATPVTAVQEDPQGRFVDVDVPFFRLNPGEKGVVTLWATKFGQPWQNASLPVSLLPASSAGPWQNGFPQTAVSLSKNTLKTGPRGTAALTLTASDPGTPRTFSDGQPGPDGQVYQVGGPWEAWGQLFLFAGASINLLVFSSYPMPAQPTWDEHVGPILSNYARMYPSMKSIIDLADYDTVVANAPRIKMALNLPQQNPHHMPIVRDLSRDKLAVINAWFNNGMPRSPGPAVLA